MLSMLLLIGGLLALPAQDSVPDYVLVIHGGAGAMSRDQMSPSLERQYRAGLQEALDTGAAILAQEGSAIEAVEATLRVLEDNPLFNAGRGAVLTSEGTIEHDASIMDGERGLAGAVAGIGTVRHPISAARRVMDSSAHVLLTGRGAEQFASAQGLERVDNSYFLTPRRQEQLESQQRGRGPSAPLFKKYGTVGAVALDKAGNLAAATSTGGMSNKRYGRVGDSPLIGAGTFASNATCAVSCTGHGEYFIRQVVAYDVAARMKYLDESVKEAAHHLIDKQLPETGGTGGLIALDRKGNFAMPFNTAGMFRGYIRSDGSSATAIYAEEE